MRASGPQGRSPGLDEISGLRESLSPDDHLQAPGPQGRTKALGLELDKMLRKEALSKPHRMLIDSQSQEESHISALTQAIKNANIKEFKS